MRAYVDSDVLIWHLRGESKALRFLRGLRDQGDNELWTGAMQRAEVVFFMRPGEEEATYQFLSQFKTAAVDQSVVDAGAELYRKWSASHGINVHDAILAATAIKTGGRIYCLNKKHYPMPDVFVQRAW
jgi:predicted nucleic acid-binding protein